MRSIAVGPSSEAVEFYTSLLPDSRITERTVRHAVTVTISPSIVCADQADVDHYRDALAYGGTPIQCGRIRDRSGLGWQGIPRIMPAPLADADRAKARCVMVAMVTMVTIDASAIEAVAQSDSN